MQKHNEDAPIPHVLIFPLPIQGPVNSMLKLAELLTYATDDIHVTFLTTDRAYNRLVLGANATTRFDRHPRISVHTFSDGLPEDHPHGSDKFLEMLEAVKEVSPSIIKKMVASDVQSLKDRPFTCMIADGLYDFAVDVGNEAGIPVLYFDTISPCCLWVYMCLPRLIDAGLVPIREKKLDAMVDIVPGMEEFLQLRDLPDHCRGRDLKDDMKMQQVLGQVNNLQGAQGIILNTFDHLESNLLKYMRSHFVSKVYTIGPIHLHLPMKMQVNPPMKIDLSEVSICSSNSFWEEDKSCMAWCESEASTVQAAIHHQHHRAKYLLHQRATKHSSLKIFSLEVLTTSLTNS